MLKILSNGKFSPISGINSAYLASDKMKNLPKNNKEKLIVAI